MAWKRAWLSRSSGSVTRPGLVRLVSVSNYYGNSYGDYSRPETTTYVKLNYTGKFINGTAFASETNSVLTYSSLISGLQEIIRKMNTGSKCRVWIPYSLGYGSSGSTNTDGSYLVDPYSALVYDVELLVATD